MIQAIQYLETGESFEECDELAENNLRPNANDECILYINGVETLVEKYDWIVKQNGKIFICKQTEFIDKFMISHIVWNTVAELDQVLHARMAEKVVYVMMGEEAKNILAHYFRLTSLNFSEVITPAGFTVKITDAPKVEKNLK